MNSCSVNRRSRGSNIINNTLGRCLVCSFVVCCYIINNTLGFYLVLILSLFLSYLYLIDIPYALH